MHRCIKRVSALILMFMLISVSAAAQGVLTFEDVMKFEDIGSIELSENGRWAAYEVAPERGDGRVEIISTNGQSTYTLMLSKNPRLTTEGYWVGAIRSVPLAEQLKDHKEKPVQGFKLLNTEDGSVLEMDSVRSFEFSNDGKWLAVRHHQSKKVKELKSKNKKLGAELRLRNLDSGEEYTLPFVAEMGFDSLSRYMAYTVVDTSGEGNGVFVFDLESESSMAVDHLMNGYYTNLSWDHSPQKLAFTKAEFDTSYQQSDASLHLWSAGEGELTTLLEPGAGDDGFVLRSNNRLRFTHDGKRLFFGFMDQEMVDLDQHKEEESEESEIDMYDIEEIRGDRELDLWHGDDPRIKTHEKNTWNERKNHLFMAVYHLDKDKWVQLADHDMPEVRMAHNPRVTLGSSSNPYLKEMTWEGFFSDWYTVDLQTGKRTLIAEKLSGSVNISPGGNYAVYYHELNWHLWDVQKSISRNLTQNMDVPFYNEDHDYPSRIPGYGAAGWIEDDKAVLIYDKFDIWRFPVDGSAPRNITDGEGRAENRIFRIRTLDKKREEAFKHNEEILLESYHDLKKNFGFYSAKTGRSGVKRLLEADKKFSFVAKGEDSDKILYKREAYDEFPNLWVADNWKFKDVEKLTHMHEDLHKKWNWGKAELIDWLSLDGKFIQGVVIKPDNYDPNKRYPIMTYYYRFFSNRLHDFNEPRTNHRPVLAQYVSDEYVVFLPDIRFEIGRPGFASTKSMVPGIQKLIELGIADEDKLGLHGHSWSGYQTAFMVTQTDIFDAAVSGAPVANMTSAYSGIRWGSGLARQFQYEKTQSRIGESLVGAPEKYIENSPVFFADKINTPMLIQHGDDDGAVPWYQSIEMYLAMRRFGKDVVFLQYHGEPHHLRKFPNKLDYAIRMKEYFDYYLKGEGNPKWIKEGEVYIGD
ncbi:MAG: S9 family peptidase [Balneolaceae bacterium]|nr:S9 family peptidase [Balneolaceae bacterium]